MTIIIVFFALLGIFVTLKFFNDPFVYFKGNKVHLEVNNKYYQGVGTIIKIDKRKCKSIIDFKNYVYTVKLPTNELVERTVEQLKPEGYYSM